MARRARVERRDWAEGLLWSWGRSRTVGKGLGSVSVHIHGFWYVGRGLLTVQLAAYIFISRMIRVRNNTCRRHADKVTTTNLRWWEKLIRMLL